MSKADDKLRENGFVKLNTEELKYSKATRQWREYGQLDITFNEEKTIDISFNSSLPIFISYYELQAINEKIKELGWGDKNE